MKVCKVVLYSNDVEKIFRRRVVLSITDFAQCISATKNHWVAGWLGGTSERETFSSSTREHTPSLLDTNGGGWILSTLETLSQILSATDVGQAL